MDALGVGNPGLSLPILSKVRLVTWGQARVTAAGTSEGALGCV